VLNASCTNIDDAALATLPPSLLVLVLTSCYELSSAASFALLTCLHTLNLRHTPISSHALASLPPSLVPLDLYRSGTGTGNLTPATVLPHLPALRVLNVSHTSLGDAAVASMPTGLEELSMVCCSNVTRRTRLSHLVALRMLQSAGTGTDLSHVTIAACRARGCFAPADGMLTHRKGIAVTALVPLPDGRLVGGGHDGRVALWESVTAGRRNAVAGLETCRSYVRALAVLRDGHRVAVGTLIADIVVWDTRRGGARNVTHPTICCESGVWALVVAHSGRLVAGCTDGKVRVVDADAGMVVRALEAHTGRPVRAVVVLLDGKVASAAEGGGMKVWNVDTGAFVLSLVGHTDTVSSLAVLSDGRLASGSYDTTVRLWDATSGACIRMLAGHTKAVHALTALPGNRLASVSSDCTIRVWDTRDDAGGAGGLLQARPLVLACWSDSILVLSPLVSLPGNRLAAGGEGGVYMWQLPTGTTGTGTST